MTKRYSLYPVSFTHAGGTLDLVQMYGASLSPGAQHGLCRPGGGLNPAAHILGNANPSERHMTRDLLSVLTGVSLTSGLACSGGHVARLQQRLAGGGFYTGTAHYTRASALGFLHIASISDDIDSQEGAEIELEYIALSNVGSNPYTEDDDVDLAAHPVPGFVSLYHMGGLWLSPSTQVTGLVRRVIRPGLIFSARRTDGGVYPLFSASSIVARAPSVDYTFLKADMTMNVMGSIFSAPLGSTLRNYYQRGTTAIDGRVSSGSSSHIRIDVPTGNWGAQSVDVSNEDDATLTVTVRPTGLISLSSLATTIP